MPSTLAPEFVRLRWWAFCKKLYKQSGVVRNSAMHQSLFHTKTKDYLKVNKPPAWYCRRLSLLLIILYKWTVGFSWCELSSGPAAWVWASTIGAAAGTRTAIWRWWTRGWVVAVRWRWWTGCGWWTRGWVAAVRRWRRAARAWVGTAAWGRIAGTWVWTAAWGGAARTWVRVVTR